MSGKIRTYLLGILLLLGISSYAEDLSDDARISLLTCSPGQELYARYGHTALRVCDPVNEMDIVFNYGIFDFNTDHFYWKFVRGETWYQLGATSMKWFIIEYKQDHRPVYEQVLQLTSEQKNALWNALRENYQPQNREYLYNFVFDNCATRPYVLIKSVLEDSIVSDYKGYTDISYRKFIRHYTGVHSWQNAGINLLFGPKADQPMNSEQRLFLPEELMLYMEQAKLSDGTPLVAKSNIGAFQIPTTPWYASWEFGLALYFLIIALVSWFDRKRGHLSWGVEIAVGIPYVLLLIIVTFLTFFSCHPLVGFGWRLLIIPLTHLCGRFVYILRW